MKWLHLSDLHYNPKGDGRSTHQLREKLIRYLEDEQITADHLFLTGDYRHAKFQADGDKDTIESIVNFILQIATTAKIPRENIHIVPGNHDLTRTKDFDRITQIISAYEPDNGRIDQADCKFLLNRFSFFKNLLQALEKQGVPRSWTNTLQPVHTYRCYSDFNIIYLNTCMTCNSDKDRGELVISNYELYSALIKIRNENPGKPIIVLAHHGADNFKSNEKRAVEQIFRDFPVKLYLCGDAHNPWQRQNNDVFELTMGCLVQGKDIRTIFSAGELRGENYSIEAHEWDTITGSWGEYSHFNRQFKKWDIHPLFPVQTAPMTLCIDLSTENTVYTSSASYTCGKIRNILLAATNGHKSEDIFNQLFCDVFHSLGFNEPNFDIDRPAGNTDIMLQHCTKKQFALIRYTAQNGPIDKAELNAFAEVLDIEQTYHNQDGYNVIGYFVSKSGFTPEAFEQEENFNEKSKKLTLLGPEQIVQELIQGHILCSLHLATHAVKYQDSTLSLCEDADLLACEYGWMWVLYYAPNPGQPATHFALVHADGNPLLNSIARVFLQQLSKQENLFLNLTYIESSSNPSINEQIARNAYFEYLQNELGEIQFEGMPTDQEAGAIKVNLENIFVPLKFQYDEKIVDDESVSYIERNTTIDGVLTRTSRAAILAKPGGGKSTLMRRIALAYAFPERRQKVEDGLPNKNWFPVYIRCRDLGEDVNKSILEIIEKTIYRAEISQYKDSFCSLIENTLQSGHLLLLIDGLDEISQEKSRICFVSQMRTFVATYPTIHLIITSREAGFRSVAGALSSYCEHYSIANLDKKQIRQLSLKWHQSLLGESVQAEEESQKVCDIILNDARIIALAENPLLLTTLLFVKRWVGYLPTKKCRLYEEMIKLLLVTWNAAGHDKLDMDETEPQLAFVAYSMTMRGLQKITKDDLTQCIIFARKALPELLSYTNLSPANFIDQVEERSSLLIQMGLEEDEKGTFVPSYEFSHLSFQEYLTAKAVTQSWLPDSDNQGLLQVLQPHIEETHWREVIPLAAVLSGRATKPLIEHLIAINETLKPNRFNNFIKKTDASTKLETQAPLHLANCIASEVPMAQQQLEKAIVLTIKNSEIIKRKVSIINRGFNLQSDLDIFTTIIKSKYGNNYRETVKKGLFTTLEMDHIYEFADSWLKIYRIDNESDAKPTNILSLLMKEDRESQVTGALLMMEYAFNLSNHKQSINIQYNDIFRLANNLLNSTDLLLIFSVVWCISWAGYNEADIIPNDIVPQIFQRLIDLWIHSEEYNHAFKRTISWGIYSLCSPNLKISPGQKLQNSIESHFYNPENDFDRCAAIHLAVLTSCWSDEKIKELIDPVKYPSRLSSNLSRFLKERGFSLNKENIANANKTIQIG